MELRGHNIYIYNIGPTGEKFNKKQSDVHGWIPACGSLGADCLESVFVYLVYSQF